MSAAPQRPSRTRTNRSSTSAPAARAQSAPPAIRRLAPLPVITMHSDGRWTANRSSAGELRSAVLKPETKKKYKTALFRFFDWCHSLDISPPASCTHMDLLMSEYMEWLYESDFRRASAVNAYFGLVHFFPQFKRNLPEAEIMMKGWNKLHPGQSYPPLTWPLTVLIAFQLLAFGQPAAAVAVLLSFDCFLRISECCKLKMEDVALPNDPRVGIAGQTWMSLNLKNTKTCKLDWTQLTRPAVSQILGRFIQGMKSDTQLFPFTTSQLRSWFHRACSALGLTQFGYTPHSLRHGAATYDSLTGVSLEDIMRRGRWASSKSARRYIQSGRSVLLSIQVPPELHAAGERIASNLTTWFGC